MDTLIRQAEREALEPVGMVYTPKSWEELEGWVEEHRKEDQAHLLVAALMAWNLACSIVR
tara:strand:- start:43 stop:222 length:180 start_codon:yes stop_codon:yes gene_type:complete